MSAALVLPRRYIASLMRPADWVEAVEIGFRAAAEGKASSPPPMAIAGDGGMFHAKGASLELDRRYVALKLNGNFPGNPAGRGLPTIQGAILLCDGSTGSLLAVLDSIEVTLQRTAAATALAARYLAPPDAGTILICGCGVQGAAQLAALRHELPLRRGFAWDRDAGRAAAFAAAASRDGFEMQPAMALAAAALQSDVIVTCTTATAPFLEASFVRAGSFVAAVGADSPEKCELHPELLARARLIADVAEQCVAMGDTHHAIEAGAIDRSAIAAELADLVTGRQPGRRSPEEIVVFDSTGTALQDVASAALIHRRAVAGGAALSVDLGAAA